MLMAQWINEKSWLCPYPLLLPPPSLLRLMAKLILCVGPFSLIVSGPGRPRYGALQAISVLWSLNYLELMLVSGMLEGLRLTVARGNLGQAGSLPVC